MTDLSNFAPVKINTLCGLETKDNSQNKKYLLHNLLALSNLIFSNQELSKILKIPRQTLYCRYYAQTPGRTVQSVALVNNSDNRSTD